MTVDTFDEHRLTIHKQLSTTDFHSSESELERCGLGLHSLFVQGNEFKSIEVRSLSCPKFGSRKTALNPRTRKAVPGLVLHIHRSIARCGNLSSGINNLPTDLSHAGSGLGNNAIASVSIAADMNILYSLLCTGEHIDVTGNSGISPEVLTFHIGTVAPAENLKSDGVLAKCHKFSNVKTGFKLGVLAVADFLSVHPDLHI